MEFIKEITVELSGEMLFEYITAVQSDVGRKIKVILLANNQPYKIPAGATAVLRGKKPDGKAILNNCTIDESGVIIAELTKQTLAVCGNVRCQVTLYSSEGGELTSVPFVVKVTAKSANDTEVKSTNEFNAIAEAEALATSAREIASEALENVLSVEEEIEGVTNAANEAAAAAIEAASEANAAKEAATAATIKANDAAEAATDVAQRISSLHANAIKGKINGAIVRVDDVSPVEHEFDVRVRSKNLIPYPYRYTTVTINDITFTDNGDGSITVKGTAKGDARFLLQENVFFGSSMESGTKDSATNGEYTISGKRILYSAATNQVMIYIYSGTTINETIYPQLELGITATEFTPYTDPSIVKVIRCGKNLINIPDMTVSSTRAKAWNAKDMGEFLLPSGTYAISADYEQKDTQTRVCVSVRSRMDANVNYTSIAIAGTEKSGKLKGTFTIPDGEFGVRLYFYSNHAQDAVNSICTFSNVQIEKGEDVTGFEEYKGEESEVSSDGTAKGITSLAPTMTLLPDKAGVTLELDYNKDVNKVIEELTNAIISLGGNI